MVILKYSTNIQWYVTLLRICFHVNYVCEIIMRCNVNLNVGTYTYVNIKLASSDSTTVTKRYCDHII